MQIWVSHDHSHYWFLTRLRCDIISINKNGMDIEMTGLDYLLIVVVIILVGAIVVRYTRYYLETRPQGLEVWEDSAVEAAPESRPTQPGTYKISRAVAKWDISETEADTE